MSASASITVTDIDHLLPQTQCGKCGHPGCRPYAEAIVEGEAINRCPPGGETTIAELAELLARPVVPLEVDAESPKAAVIREDECIGCTKCIQACPVDAILGASKQMHTVIEAECTGCELCVAPCPVDCIDIVAHPGWQATRDEREQKDWLARRAEQGRRRFEHRNARLERQRQEKDARRRERMRARQQSRSDDRKQSEHVPSTSAPASSRPAGNARARKAAISATVRRLEKRLSADPANQEDQNALERARQQLADLQAQGDTGVGSTDSAQDTASSSSLNSLRIARSAAKQRLALANRQLAHARRQGGPEDIEAAQALIDRAEKTWQDACQALDNAERH
ncbi:electron transport complex subunit RsxB [Kushneria indalinina]|uniref:Ion-translocating oxidoreductase complex subunit B n=1 Tax=Kushneria indalinina DSM 14324 TaxID=1122140 RepID=A0A3D9DXG2_9GAMM|nr:electron transport complex subunit RsxB [Kushneria indalinina]REC95468.1 electron transport complex protein RnfB [Kushneria indalinina DSM 14324]